MAEPAGVTEGGCRDAGPDLEIDKSGLVALARLLGYSETDKECSAALKMLMTALTEDVAGGSAGLAGSFDLSFVPLGSAFADSMLVPTAPSKDAILLAMPPCEREAGSPLESVLPCVSVNFGLVGAEIGYDLAVPGRLDEIGLEVSGSSVFGSLF